MYMLVWPSTRSRCKALLLLARIRRGSCHPPAWCRGEARHLDKNQTTIPRHHDSCNEAKQNAQYSWQGYIKASAIINFAEWSEHEPSRVSSVRKCDGPSHLTHQSIHRQCLK